MVRAVIMAGGMGTRLEPITSTRSKSLVPLVNRPIMINILELLRNNGFNDVVITLHHMNETIMKAFGNGEELDMNITYSIESKPLGTAGGVRNIERDLDDTFIVISSDLLTDFKLSELVDFHHKSKASMTIASTYVENPVQYGIINVGDKYRVKKYIEKPKLSEVFGNAINSGIYIINREILNLINENIPFDFSKDFIPELLRLGEPIFAKPMEGFWSDIGNPSKYLWTNHQILKGRTNIGVKGKMIKDKVWVEKGSEISKFASLSGPIAIGKNSKIMSDVHIGPNTVIGSDVTISSGVKVESSVIFNSTKLNKNSRAFGCIIGENVNVGCGVRIKQEAIIGDGNILQEGCIISEKSKIWPNKIVKVNNLVTGTMK